jgi:hypothetical protein
VEPAPGATAGTAAYPPDQTKIHSPSANPIRRRRHTGEKSRQAKVSVPRTKPRQASPFWITDKSYRRCGLSQSVPVADRSQVTDLRREDSRSLCHHRAKSTCKPPCRARFDHGKHLDALALLSLSQPRFRRSEALDKVGVRIPSQVTTGDRLLVTETITSTGFDHTLITPRRVASRQDGSPRCM